MPCKCGCKSVDNILRIFRRVQAATAVVHVDTAQGFNGQVFHMVVVMQEPHADAASHRL